MRSYKVIITPDAEANLLEIKEYITYTLLVPETAKDYLESLREEIGKLSYLGASIASVQEEPWHSRGLRKVTAKNFYIYYLVNEERSTVSVMNVIYRKRDQAKALEEKRKQDKR
ncbi:MAG: type II toxin-antitoxin system RelE/ParE family toxin [Lachnospiraceae bacterium]|nr:type II toxin-antitoxin system RelE/ParE family toxin [Lachnospiraceae bacterium]